MRVILGRGETPSPIDDDGHEIVEVTGLLRGILARGGASSRRRPRSD